MGRKMPPLPVVTELKPTADTPRKIHRWLVPGGRLMISSGGVVENHPDGFTDTMFGQEFYSDSLPPTQMVALLEEIGFEIVRAEMSNPPDGENDKGKWATVASRKG